MRDIAYMKAKMAYIVSSLETECRTTSKEFSKRTWEENLELRDNKRDLKIARKRAPRAVSLEKADNRRYYSFVMTDLSTVRFGGAMDMALLGELREKLINLLVKRDEINERLTELYLGSARNGNAAERDKAERIARDKEHRTQSKLARKISITKVSNKYREKLYELMDEQVELAGAIARSRYILANERPSGRARKDALTTLEKSKKTFKKNKSTIRKIGKRALSEAKERRIKNGRFVLALMLILVIGAAAGVLIWKWQAVLNIVLSFFPFLGQLLP